MNTPKIEYSAVSRGTEKYNNKGYIAITNIINNYRYIVNEDHGIEYINNTNDSLKANKKYNIYNVVLSRFELIPALMFCKNKDIQDNILLCGLGNVGFSTLLYLLDNSYKNITIYIRHNKKYIKELIDIIYKEYKVKLNIVNKINIYNSINTYIDTTGSSEVLESIFDNITFNKTVLILSTPRDDDFKISPLIINRKSIRIIGRHEFNGIEFKEREKLYNKLLKINKNKSYLNLFFNEYNYSKNRLNRIKDKKNNIIEIFKYQ